jgi:tetratricopeptide (TPR) repeat protein
MADEAIAMARRLDDPQALLEALEMRFLFDRAPSEIHRRLATMDEMLGLARRLSDKRLLLDILEMRYMDRMALGQREAGDFIEEHARLADELKDPFYVLVGLDFYLGASGRCLGQLAASMARWDEAEAHFEHALDLNERTGAQVWLAHSRYQYGRMLLARGRTRDRERARQLTALALATSRELGMSGLAARIVASDRGPAVPWYPSPLNSGREQAQCRYS